MGANSIVFFSISDLTHGRKLVGDILNYIATYVDISKEKEFEIKLILNELIVNSFVYGNQQESGIPVRVLVHIRDEKLILHIMDSGKGSQEHLENALNRGLEQITTGPNLMSEHGRGLQLVKSLCEQVEYSRFKNKIMVTMVMN